MPEHAPVYADHAATAPMCDAARRAYLSAADTAWANPSSIHSPGQAAKAVLEEAREQIARCLNAHPGEITFTSGGSESDVQALHSLAALAAEQGRRRILAAAFEHHAVLHTLDRLQEQGFTVEPLPVPRDGVLRPAEIEARLTADTAFVSVMTVNNEIGTIQPIEQIAAACRAHGVPVHTDAVQAAGHIPVDVRQSGVDLLSVSAHKLGGPKGIGVLYARRGIRLHSVITGGAQERGRRAGTENVPAAAGMAAALQARVSAMPEEAARIRALRDRLIDGLQQTPGCALNGARAALAPGIANLSFAGVDSENLLLLLDNEGVAASAGSACTAGALTPSHVLTAIGLPEDAARGSLRLSLGPENTDADIDRLLAVIPRVVTYLRAHAPG